VSEPLLVQHHRQRCLYLFLDLQLVLGIHLSGHGFNRQHRLLHPRVGLCCLEIETPKANVIPDFCRMFVMLVIGDLLDEEMEVESSLGQLCLEVRPFQ
jgi:hypothetical protein